MRTRRPVPNYALRSTLALLMLLGFMVGYAWTVANRPARVSPQWHTVTIEEVHRSYLDRSDDGQARFERTMRAIR